MHDHGHTHAEHPGQRPLRLALAITAGFLLVEVAGALLTGSLALLADAGHTLSDAAALGMALFAFWVSAHPATQERTYGYYRAEVLAALANAVTLVVVAVYTFVEASHRLTEPHPVQSLPMLAVACVGVAANAAAAWVLARGAGENLNVRSAFLHVVNDIFALIGTIVAALVIYLTGWLYADPIASVVIGILVLASGWRLLRESTDVLLEATPRHIALGDVERAMCAVDGVRGVHDLHVWTLTSGFLAMSGHLTVEEDDDHRVLAAATDILRQRFGIDHVTLQLERGVEQEQLHRGCYVGPGMTGCVTAPIGHAAGHAEHGR